MLQYNEVLIMVLTICGLGILFSIYCLISISLINVSKHNKDDNINKHIEQDNEEEILAKNNESIALTENECKLLKLTVCYFSNGTKSYIFNLILTVFFTMLVISLIIYLTCEKINNKLYTTLAFVTGCINSIICLYVSITISNIASYKYVYKSYISLQEAFVVSLKGGCAISFFLTSLTIGMLTILISIYYYLLITPEVIIKNYMLLFESIAGFALGNCLVSLFNKVGGSMFSKATDISCDYVNSNNVESSDFDIYNHTSILTNIGEKVNYIGGNTSSLCDTLVECLCAILIISTTSPQLVDYKYGGVLYPLLTISVCQLACIFISILVIIYINKFCNSIEPSTNSYLSILNTLRFSNFITTILVIPLFYICSYYGLPVMYNIGYVNTLFYKTEVSKYNSFTCLVLGAFSGLIININSDYFTSYYNKSVQSLRQISKQGSEYNIISGLALGKLSCILPGIIFSVSIYYGYKLAGFYGISLIGLGLISNINLYLSFNCLNPVSSNAKKLAILCNLDPRIKLITEELSFVSEHTDPFVKSFSFSSCFFISVSLYAAYITNINGSIIVLYSPEVLSSLIIGAMMPFMLNGIIIESLHYCTFHFTRIISDGLKNILCLFNKKNNESENNAIKIHNALSTNFINVNNDNPIIENLNNELYTNIACMVRKSLLTVIIIGMIVIIIPIILGVFLGPVFISGFLIGFLISGIYLTITCINSGEAWSSCSSLCLSKLIFKLFYLILFRRRNSRN